MPYNSDSQEIQKSSSRVVEELRSQEEIYCILKPCKLINLKTYKLKIYVSHIPYSKRIQADEA